MLPLPSTCEGSEVRKAQGQTPGNPQTKSQKSNLPTSSKRRRCLQRPYNHGPVALQLGHNSQCRLGFSGGKMPWAVARERPVLELELD